MKNQKQKDKILIIENVTKALDKAEIMYNPQDNCLYQSVYFGSVFDNAPSGKYYMPWCSNVTEEEAQADEEYFEQLQQELDEIGACYEAGEGDSTDMIFTRPYASLDEIPGCDDWCCKIEFKGIDDGDDGEKYALFECAPFSGEKHKEYRIRISLERDE